MIPETVDYHYYGDNLDVLRRYIKDETVGAQARSLGIFGGRGCKCLGDGDFPNCLLFSRGKRHGALRK